VHVIEPLGFCDSFLSANRQLHPPNSYSMGLSYTLQHLAVPAVIALIFFLAYGSQVLFYFTEPRPLNVRELFQFNSLVAAIFICYYRACSTEPGRVPLGWTAQSSGKDEADGGEDGSSTRHRWCRKCNVAKPPRAHHCKICKRCVLKMDHHW